jgi:transposase
MFLKRHLRRKNGKQHVYYSLCESTRLSRRRVLQRRLLNLGELNTTQLEQWQRSIAVIEEDGRAAQKRLFTDREGLAPDADDICEVRLSTLRVRHPREFGNCWLGCRLFEELQLDTFFAEQLEHHRGPEDWAKGVELPGVNRLCAPGSELSVHERWFERTAMDHLLGCGPGVAGKDRLSRALDKLLPLKSELERHLGQRWQGLFGADTQVLLYDLTSTYFEGTAEGVEGAVHGYSRDHRPDCRQVVLALVVTTEGLPLTYELFSGNTNDATTLRQIIDTVEKQHGRAHRIWVFDRGLVSQENLDLRNEREVGYLVGTPRHRLDEFERQLLKGDWQKVAGRPGVRVQLIEREDEIYVLARSEDRAQKEWAMRRRLLSGLSRDLRALGRAVRSGRLVNQRKIDQRLGRIQERWGAAWRYLLSVDAGPGWVIWKWDSRQLRLMKLRDGACLLRSNMARVDPEILWRQYVQLTEVEEAFRVLKSELNLRPIWHRIDRRVAAHVFIAFLGYALWACLKQKLRAVAGSITPARALESLAGILMVEVWFELRDGRKICLPRITEPEAEQQLLLHHLRWSLPEQPPPQIHPADVK